MIRWAHRQGTFKARNRLQAHELRQQLGLVQTTGSHDPLSSIPVSSAALAALTPRSGPRHQGRRPLILLMVGPLWRQFFCSLSPEVQAAETFEDRCRLVAASIRLRQYRRTSARGTMIRRSSVSPGSWHQRQIALGQQGWAPELR
jgi:hypothetical protein